MALARMDKVFSDNVAAFNKAVRDNDRDKMAELGGKLLNIALDECAKPGVYSEIKDKYRSDCSAVIKYLQKLAKNPPAAVNTGGSGEGDGASGDPYYVTKQWFSDEAPNLKFTDIIGAQTVKDAFLTDVIAAVEPKFREVYKKFRGEQMGAQVLLYGPPGTGKTHIVKCLAGVLKCKIAVVQTSEVLAGIVGVAEKNMRDIFAQAAELDRSIIFLDEIDSLCSDRSSDDSRHTKSILTTMLTCMDGFVKTTKPGQMRIVIAATNLPWALDSALKRGGRFDTQIYVPLPELEERKVFITRALKDKPCAADVTVDYLATCMDKFAGADINAAMKHIINEPLRREIINISKYGQPKGEVITVKDCEKVLATYINGVTDETLQRFEAYNLGMSYEDYLLKRAVGQIPPAT